MLLQQAIIVMTALAWVALLGAAIIYVVRKTQRDGFEQAVRGLVSQRSLIILLLFALLITFIQQALVFIAPQEVGIVVSLFSSEGYRDRPFRSGLHWIVPFMEQVHRYPISYQTYTMSGKTYEGQVPGDDSIEARTSDGQDVFIDCTVIFSIDAEQALRVHIGWQDRYVDDFVRPLMRGIVRTQVSQYTVEEVNSSKRLNLERDMSAEVSREMRDKGFAVDRFLLRNVTFSPEYAAAVEEKQVAQQNILKTQHQREQIITLAQADAEAARERARGEADALKLLGAALAENPDVATLRYIDKLAPNIQVMLLPNNAPFIFPIPTLNASRNVTATQNVTPTIAAQDSTPESAAPEPNATPVP